MAFLGCEGTPEGTRSTLSNKELTVTGVRHAGQTLGGTGYEGTQCALPSWELPPWASNSFQLIQFSPWIQGDSLRLSVTCAGLFVTQVHLPP